MGKKLAALFGRNFKSSKFRPLVNLAVARLAVLKNRRLVRLAQNRSDVVQLLQHGHHERALLRVDQVIREQNMLDAYVILEHYLNLLIERVILIEKERECPDELKEAASGVIFAASRCGDFPELQEIRSLLTSRFGKEFAASAVELRNNCGVNPVIIQKLSSKQSSLEIKMKLLKELAAENRITLLLEGASTPIEQENLEASKKQEQPEPAMKGGEGLGVSVIDEGFSDSMKDPRQFTDVADAAMEAFEAAAYAAAAARAAVELSRSQSLEPRARHSPKPPRRILSYQNEVKQVAVEPESHHESTSYIPGPSKDGAEFKRSPSASSSGSAAAAENQATELGNVPKFDDSDGDSDDEQNNRLPELRPISKPEALSPGGSTLESPRLNLERKPITLRTRRLRGF